MSDSGEGELAEEANVRVLEEGDVVEEVGTLLHADLLLEGAGKDVQEPLLSW